MSETWGPTWFYVIAALWLHAEYFLWPLEMSEYLYRPNDQKFHFVSDPINLSQWVEKSMIWGSITGGFAFVLVILYVSISEITNYVEMQWYYVYALLMYSVQNWFFFGYLLSLEQGPTFLSLTETETETESSTESLISTDIFEPLQKKHKYYYDL